MKYKLSLLIILLASASCITVDSNDDEPFIYITSNTGYVYSSRQSEDPQGTTRPLDLTWILKANKESAPLSPPEKTENQASTDDSLKLRRKHLQLRRNRYLLLRNN